MRALAALLVVLWARAASAQCAGPEVHTFDFLIGSWTGTHEVSAVSKGPLAGPSVFTIAPILGGCALEETWSFYPTEKEEHAKLWRAFDKPTGKWTIYFVNGSLLPQVWEGRLENGGWWFYRDYVRDGVAYRSRQSWVPNKDGFARHIERTKDSGKTWEVTYTGDYVRSDGPVRAAALAYVNGRDGKDAALLRSAFTASANLYFRGDSGDLTEIPIAQYIERVAAAKDAPPKAEIAIDVLDQTASVAIVRVVNRTPARTVTDYLELVKVKDAWKIAAKVFDRSN